MSCHVKGNTFQLELKLSPITGILSDKFRPLFMLAKKKGVKFAVDDDIGLYLLVHNTSYYSGIYSSFIIGLFRYFCC
jgi:hypothetical protein